MTVTSTDIGTDVVLRDGSTVRVRPARATDRDGLAALFDGLTLDSRRMRFFSASANIAQAARWASEADRPERLSLVATAGPDATVIAHAVLVALDAERLSTRSAARGGAGWSRAVTIGSGADALRPARRGPAAASEEAVCGAGVSRRRARRWVRARRERRPSRADRAGGW